MSAYVLVILAVGSISILLEAFLKRWMSDTYLFKVLYSTVVNTLILYLINLEIYTPFENLYVAGTLFVICLLWSIVLVFIESYIKIKVYYNKSVVAVGSGLCTVATFLRFFPHNDDILNFFGLGDEFSFTSKSQSGFSVGSKSQK